MASERYYSTTEEEWVTDTDGSGENIPSGLEATIHDSDYSNDASPDSFDDKKIGLHKQILEILEELKDSSDVFSRAHSIFESIEYKEFFSFGTIPNCTSLSSINSVLSNHNVSNFDLDDALNKYKKVSPVLEKTSNTIKDEVSQLEKKMSKIYEQNNRFLNAETQPDSSINLITHFFRQFSVLLGGASWYLTPPNLGYIIGDSDTSKNKERLFHDLLSYQVRIGVFHKKSPFRNFINNYEMIINQFTEIFNYLSKSNGSECYVSDIIDETVEAWKTESGDGRDIIVYYKDKQLELKTNRELLSRGIGYLLDLVTKKPQNGIPIKIQTYYDSNRNISNFATYKEGYIAIHISHPKILDDHIISLLKGNILPEITPSVETLSFLTKTTGVLGGETKFSTNGDTQAVDIYLPANGYNKAKTVEPKQSNLKQSL